MALELLPPFYTSEHSSDLRKMYQNVAQSSYVKKRTRLLVTCNNMATFDSNFNHIQFEIRKSNRLSVKSNHRFEIESNAKFVVKSIDVLSVK